MTDSDTADLTRREQFSALMKVGKYRPGFTVGIILVSVIAASFEAVGFSFILPIIEIVQSAGDPTREADGMLSRFVRAYQALGVSLTLGSAVAGVSLILTVRWILTFSVRWLRSILVIDYIRELQTHAYENSLEAKIEYFDQEGSDDILNAIVTQAEYAGNVIQYIVNFVEQGLLSLVYLGIAMTLAPKLTILAISVLGGFTIFFRTVLDSGYDVGDKVADANEQLQQAAQAGTQGIRDTKLFNLKSELLVDFLTAIDQYAAARTRQRRNEEILNNFYNLITAVSVFVLIYLAITYANMSLGSLGVFLFAMFRLGPKVSGLNSKYYRIESYLPHLVRTQQFIDEIKANREPDHDSIPTPQEIKKIECDNIHFSYEGYNEKALSGISLQFTKGDFIGFVGQSGSGKSTFISLLVRLYEPDRGEIRANGCPIHQMDIDTWRRRVAVVRQDPFIFNDTLQYNLTIGNRNVSQSELDQVTEIAYVNEFFEELPEGYETQLGDDGVRLSGGQRQRVALARALLKDADILVLDEATSDLDSDLEQQVQAAIENMQREYAIVGIAHRLSTVRNADQVYTLDQGEITETGTHEELIKNGGQYAHLHKIQSET